MHVTRDSGVVIVAADERAAYFQQPCGLSVPGQLIIFVIDYLHLDAVERAPLLLPDGELLLPGQFLHFRFQGIEGAQGAHLRHPPGMIDINAMALLELLHYRPGAGRPADHDPSQGIDLFARFVKILEQVQPHGGHPGGIGHLFLFNQCLQGCAIAHFGAREYQLGAGYGRAVGQTPGIDVEHGHHRHDHIPDRQVKAIR